MQKYPLNDYFGGVSSSYQGCSQTADLRDKPSHRSHQSNEKYKHTAREIAQEKKNHRNLGLEGISEIIGGDITNFHEIK